MKISRVLPTEDSRARTYVRTIVHHFTSQSTNERTNERTKAHSVRGIHNQRSVLACDPRRSLTRPLPRTQDHSFCRHGDLPFSDRMYLYVRLLRILSGCCGKKQHNVECRYNHIVSWSDHSATHTQSHAVEIYGLGTDMIYSDWRDS